jgi:hypothetical protein
MGRSYREENIQYFNYLLGKENWKLIFKQNSASDAYYEFLDTFQYYHNIAMPKKWINIRQHKNKWVTAGKRVSGDRLRSLSKLRKEGIMSEEVQKYYCQYKKIYNKVLCEAKKLNNNVRIRSSGNKSKAMWELVKEELVEQRKTPKNIQLK